MKAVVMAGGEGTRLRPMTATLPKPLLPVVNKPIMEHVLDLLKRHGMTDTVVTVQFLASILRNYFGDGEELGMRLTYATEDSPLGTAGSVKNAEAELRDDTFLVISGDALTDIDLTALVDFHRKRGALVTVCLTRVPDPLEFGITITDDDGRVQRFLEKPTWGQVFSDTVNTGIYVMEPEVFDYVPAGESVDWSGDVFPKLLADGLPVFGYVADGYWEDVGTLESYLRGAGRRPAGQGQRRHAGFEVSPGVWVAEGAEVERGRHRQGPGLRRRLRQGRGRAPSSASSPSSGSNVVVREGAFVHRSVVHDNVFVGPQTNLRGCVIGKNTDLMRGSRVEEGAIIGDECVVEEEAIVSPGVKVYPFKTIEAGAVVHESVIWESTRPAHDCSVRAASPASSTSRSPRSWSCDSPPRTRRPCARARPSRPAATTPVPPAPSSARSSPRSTPRAIDVRDLEVTPAAGHAPRGDPGRRRRRA